MGHRDLKSEIDNSKDIALESIQTDFKPKHPPFKITLLNNYNLSD
jgi:hypothetical protein